MCFIGENCQLHYIFWSPCLASFIIYYDHVLYWWKLSTTLHILITLLGKFHYMLWPRALLVKTVNYTYNSVQVLWSRHLSLKNVRHSIKKTYKSFKFSGHQISKMTETCIRDCPCIFIIQISFHRHFNFSQMKSGTNWDFHDLLKLLLSFL